jgi:hypothetical protein
MANPYDFTSGFLTAVQIRSQEKQAQDLKEYREEAISVERQKARDERAYRSGTAIPYYDAITKKTIQETAEKAKKAELFDQIYPHVKKQFKELFPGTLEDETAIKENKNKKNEPYVPYFNKPLSTNSGMVNDDQTEVVDAGSDPYTFAADGYSPEDGTDINNQSAIPTTSEQQAPIDNERVAAIDGMQIAAAKTKSASPASADSQSNGSMFKQVQQIDPDKANSITKTVYGASDKQFQKLIGAFSLLRFATGEGTPKELLDNVNVIKKMQVENVGTALSRGLSGDYKGAAEAFAASGDDRGEGIDGFRIVKIKNDISVPGKKKGLVDSYDGLEIKYKDGRDSIILDPRKLMAESIGLAEMVKFTTGLEEKLRDDQIKVDVNSENAAVRRLQAQMTNENKLIQQTNTQLMNLENVGKARIANEEKAITDPQSPNYIVDDPARTTALNRLQSKRSLITGMAAQFVTDTKGAQPTSYSLYENATKDLSTPDAFIMGNNQGKVGPVATKIGQTIYVQHKNGAYIPVDYTIFGAQK